MYGSGPINILSAFMQNSCAVTVELFTVQHISSYQNLKKIHLL